MNRRTVTENGLIVLDTGHTDPEFIKAGDELCKLLRQLNGKIKIRLHEYGAVAYPPGEVCMVFAKFIVIWLDPTKGEPSIIEDDEPDETEVATDEADSEDVA